MRKTVVTMKMFELREKTKEVPDDADIFVDSRDGAISPATFLETSGISNASNGQHYGDGYLNNGSLVNSVLLTAWRKSDDDVD